MRKADLANAIGVSERTLARFNHEKVIPRDLLHLMEKKYFLYAKDYGLKTQYSCGTKFHLKEYINDDFDSSYESPAITVMAETEDEAKKQFLDYLYNQEDDFSLYVIISENLIEYSYYGDVYEYDIFTNNSALMSFIDYLYNMYFEKCSSFEELDISESDKEKLYSLIPKADMRDVYNILMDNEIFVHIIHTKNECEALEEKKHNYIVENITALDILSLNAILDCLRNDSDIIPLKVIFDCLPDILQYKTITINEDLLGKAGYTKKQIQLICKHLKYIPKSVTLYKENDWKSASLFDVYIPNIDNNYAYFAPQEVLIRLAKMGYDFKDGASEIAEEAINAAFNSNK
jgi:hypothetical protein